jgi:hypothetical protein
MNLRKFTRRHAFTALGLIGVAPLAIGETGTRVFSRDEVARIPDPGDGQPLEDLSAQGYGNRPLSLTDLAERWMLAVKEEEEALQIIRVIYKHPLEQNLSPDIWGGGAYHPAEFCYGTQLDGLKESIRLGRFPTSENINPAIEIMKAYAASNARTKENKRLITKAAAAQEAKKAYLDRLLEEALASKSIPFSEV